MAGGLFEFGEAFFQRGDAGGGLFFHAFERGDEQAVHLVLLGPQPVGVELEQLPDRRLEGDEQGAEDAPALADLEVGDVDEDGVAEAGEVEGDESSEPRSWARLVFSARATRAST